ncbi:MULTISPECIES: helix-turn-helix transcriptional regulator [unclassified Streptomyces]|uniref:helix-turn-helix domain-containing protein n=1 Tax=unclassified Streptomyces TaxID=2593676 RepID=UPI000DD78B28|nr:MULTISPECIES: helix-turn-helix transcriptional regulator [unclassified Streptomyces]QZZ28559.1 helix-turn-helix domain-containing protein [Streptomyces sp. ST1015]
MARRKDLDPATSSRALVGEELKHARERSGYSQTALGALLFVSGSYVGQMEAGIRRIRPEMGPQLDKELGTGDFFTRHSKAMAKSKYPDHFAEAVEAEAEATEIRQYASTLIPGLLQTKEYATAVFRAFKPFASDAEIEEDVALRLERARILDDPTTPLLWTILDEAALRRPVGSPAVMAQNLRHIAELIRKHRIIVQVLPFSTGAHVAMEGPLKLMEFEDAPPLSFIEATGMGHLIDDPATVTRHTLMFNLLAASALPPQDSLALIESVAEDYAHEEQH